MRANAKKLLRSRAELDGFFSSLARLARYSICNLREVRDNLPHEIGGCYCYGLEAHPQVVIIRVGYLLTFLAPTLKLLLEAAAAFDFTAGEFESDDRRAEIPALAAQVRPA